MTGAGSGGRRTLCQLSASSLRALELTLLTPARAHDQPAGESPVPRRDDVPARPLTDRQLEILTNVAHGRTNRQIGEKLGISEKTVRNHLRTISHKLNSSDRTHSVVLAIGNGWIPIPIQPDTPTEVHDATTQADGQLQQDGAESVVPSTMKASTAGAD